MQAAVSRAARLEPSRLLEAKRNFTEHLERLPEISTWRSHASSRGIDAWGGRCPVALISTRRAMSLLHHGDDVHKPTLAAALAAAGLIAQAATESDGCEISLDDSREARRKTGTVTDSSDGHGDDRDSVDTVRVVFCACKTFSLQYSLLLTVHATQDHDISLH